MSFTTFRSALTCSPGPGDGHSGPVLVPRGSGYVDGEKFSTYLGHLKSEVSFAAFRSALACSPGPGDGHGGPVLVPDLPFQAS